MVEFEISKMYKDHTLIDVVISMCNSLLHSFIKSASQKTVYIYGKILLMLNMKSD